MEKWKELLRTVRKALDVWFSRDERLQIAVLLAKSNSQAKIIKDFNMVKAEDEVAAKWDKKWPKAKITYRAQGGIERDVRNLVCDKSFVLNSIAERFRGLPPEEIAFKVEELVKDEIRYVGDFNTHNTSEFWEHPENLWHTKKGDCEDGALLIASLMRIAGVPAYKIKICAGFVSNPANVKEVIGHAYCIFLRDDDSWCVLDWCYYPTDRRIEFRPQHKEMKEYKDIWFTFNDRFCFSQHDVVI